MHDTMLWLLLCYTACFLPFYLFVCDVKRTISQSASCIDTVEIHSATVIFWLTYDAASASATKTAVAAIAAVSVTFEL